VCLVTEHTTHQEDDMNRISIAAAATAALGLATLTGCYGQDDGAKQAPAGGQQAAPATSAPSAPAGGEAPAGGATASLSATESDTLGAIVTDDGGRTLYRFDEDSADPSVSNCAGDCAAKWPPALAGSTVRVQGVAKELVGTVTRADGSKQLTLNGWPLYRLAKDAKAGDTLGQGVGGTWFAATPEGKKAAEQATGESQDGDSDTGDNGSGYGY
jgi:predicted lipoprotein with Yx(FWY)xxD motif